MIYIDYDRPFIFHEPDILTPEECTHWIEAMEEAGPAVAPINSRQGVVVNTRVRNNERVIFDDQAWADKLLERIRDMVPETIHGMHLVGVNERFRAYRYQPGMRFAPHSDGAFHRDYDEQSYYTFLIYLNEDFEGGHTIFSTDPEIDIAPRTGMGLWFQHPIVHEGAVVTQGTKYVLRSDLMYRNLRQTDA